MVVYNKLELECNDKKIKIEKGERFPLDSDEKLEECRTKMIARADWPGRPGEPSGDVAVYEYNGDKKYFMVTNYDMTDEIVDAISDDPLEAVGYAVMDMLDWSLKHNAQDVSDILVTYAKLVENLPAK